MNWNTNWTLQKLLGINAGINMGTQREILSERPKSSNKAWIKRSEAILNTLEYCWEKISLFLTPRKTDGRVPSQQSAPTTCNLTYWEIS